MKDLPTRNRNRLADYDYSQGGAYFVTFCVKDRRPLLWAPAPVGAHIVRPPLSSFGEIVAKAIANVPAVHAAVSIDHYVVMPNHVHCIVRVDARDDGDAPCVPTVSLVIKQVKEYVTKQIGFPLWQKSFHDRIIRDEGEYLGIWRYIDENLARWAEDEYFIGQL